MNHLIPLFLATLISSMGTIPSGVVIDDMDLQAFKSPYRPSGSNTFLEHADRSLAIMAEAAREMSVQGVAVVAYIPEDKNGSWISKMKVAGTLTNGSANFLAVAYSKAAEMADTRKNSGKRDGEPLHGEFGYQGGVVAQVEPGYIMAVFSGATGEQDTEIAEKGLEALELAYRNEDPWPPGSSPHHISGLVIEDLLSREEFMMYRTEQVRAVHYAEVCTAFGAARLAGWLKDEEILARLSERYLRVIDEGIENTANHVDANVYGILPLELYLHTGNKRFLEQGMALADGQWEDPLPDGLTHQTRYWIDDVWMIGSLQVQAYRITGDTTYLNRAAAETTAYLQKLQQPNGLFYHGPDAPFFWGRGNGWVAAGLAEVISELPPAHPMYATVKEGYVTMMNALLAHQSESGMWRQLIDVESAWEETSCTAMFGYAIALGVQEGILDRQSFETSYAKAWMALTEKVSADGKVEGVCVGTGQSRQMEYYLERPTVKGDFHGQAPILWLAYRLMLE
jgi:rhamnogalacturonyl hydrolase YesR